MKRMRIRDVTDNINMLVNCVFAKIEQKERLQTNTILLFGMACKAYHSDPAFRNDMNNLMSAIESKKVTAPN